MLRGLAKSMVIGAVQKRTGVSPVGTIPAALMTSGLSLLLTRGKRPVGLALAAIGGLLLWREAEARRSALSPPEPGLAPDDDAAATARR